MYNKLSQSIMDYLMLVIKDFPNMNLTLRKKKDPIAEKLYSLWSDKSNKIADRNIKIPKDLSNSDIRKLESSGFVQIHGKNLRITSKGENTLRQMILDDDNFALKKSNSDKIIKTASSKRCNWYLRIKNDDIAS